MCHALTLNSKPDAALNNRPVLLNVGRSLVEAGAESEATKRGPVRGYRYLLS